MNQEKKKLLKEVLFCVQLGFKVIGTFIFTIIIGLTLDDYFNTHPTILLILLFLAFGYIIKILIGAGKE